MKWDQLLCEKIKTNTSERISPYFVENYISVLHLNSFFGNIRVVTFSLFLFNLPYAHHHYPLLIRNTFEYILTIHKDFKKWVKNIKTAG